MQSCDHWYPLQEFFHYSMGTVLIFIASVVAVVKSGGVSALVVASVRRHVLAHQGRESGFLQEETGKPTHQTLLIGWSLHHLFCTCGSSF